MSILLLGVWPGQALEEQIRQTKPRRPLPLTASEKRGRAIYAREGCAYCHTQQIRYLAKDVARFGAATLAWETIFDYPHLWGTRRIGPDLSREAGIRSADWQFSHLYAPRSVVADSVMPAFPWLFDGRRIVPGRKLAIWWIIWKRSAGIAIWQDRKEKPMPGRPVTVPTMKSGMRSARRF